MSDSTKLNMLVSREIQNALGLAAMGGRNASKAAERVAHVVEITEADTAAGLRSSAMRLRITASDCLEAAMTIGAEAARLELIATLRVGLTSDAPITPHDNGGAQ
jgi:hypothetical protein